MRQERFPKQETSQSDTYDPDISLVIRVRNEKDNLNHLLDFIQDQTKQPEIIVVDNESTDGTRQLAADRADKVIDIYKADFTYPRASNKGVRAAEGELIAMLSAHSFPMRHDMLEQGSRHFEEPNLAGVYAPTLSRRDTTLGDRVQSYLAELLMENEEEIVRTKPIMGIMQSTNAIYRKNLLEERPFDERFAAGGEDRDWARWALQEGYRIIQDKKLMVWHSHSLGPVGWGKQYYEWWKIRKPNAFERKAIAYKRKGNE